MEQLRYSWNIDGQDFLFEARHDGFRLYETHEPNSAHALRYAKPIPATINEKEIRWSGFTLSYEEGRLKLVKQGQTLFEAELIGSVSSSHEQSLAEKEGHRLETGDATKGGLRIFSRRPVYGLGEKTGPLDKRGYSYINWNTDDPSAHVDTFPYLYQSNPFFVLFDSKQSIGVLFDNSGRTFFDFNKNEPDADVIRYVEGAFDLTVYYGTFQEVLRAYAQETLKVQLVPYWSLGAQQSRWSYPTAAKVDEVIQGYREADIPLSVVYLDIDYMVDYEDFTVDEGKFPDLESWLARLKDEGVRIVPIIDAGVKALEGYDVYDEGMGQGLFCTLNGEVYHNEVWPGDSVFPAFLDERTQQWWATHVAKTLERGFSGIWNDMNEPVSFKGPLPLDVDMGGTPHSLAHNVYGHYMCKAGAQGFALAKKRLFQLTRAGYASTASYSGSWAGDNQSIYDHLRLMIPELLNMSLSGQGYVGVDLGGFGGDATPELLVRFAEAGLLNPLYRNHSALGTLDQEPYLLPEPYLSAYRHAVKTRYELLPTLYDALWRNARHGEPVLRPLVYNYPEDERLINENTELMLGDALLLAPALFPGEQVRSVYFPATFYDFFTGKRYEKGDHLIDVSIGSIPLFYAEKSLFVLNEKGRVNTEMSEVLRVFWGGKAAKCIHFEDDGDELLYDEEGNLIDDAYNEFELIMGDGGDLKICALHQGRQSRYKKVELVTPAGTKELPFLID